MLPRGEIISKADQVQEKSGDSSARNRARPEGSCAAYAIGTCRELPTFLFAKWLSL